MAASVKLTILNNFKEAEDDIKSFGKVTTEELNRIQKAREKFTSRNLDAFIDKTNRAAAAMKATRGPAEALAAQQRILRRQIETLIRNGFDPQDEKLKNLKEKYIDVSSRLNDLTEAQRKNAEATKKAADEAARQANILKEVNDRAVQLAKYGLVAIATGTVAMGAGFISAAAKIEDAQAAFRPILGSFERATELVGMINETAATTPFQFEDIAMSAKQLLPAVNGNMEQVIKTFRMLGDTASGNAQRLDSVTRAYTKSILKGVVDMKSMNMMARAGVPIFTELASVIGVNVKQLMEMSRRGEITSDHLVAAFEKMTSEGGIFFNGMQIASKTLTGRLSTLKDNIFLLAANLGKELLPYAKAFVETALDITQMLRTITSSSKGARAILELLTIALVNATVALTAFIIASKGAIALEYLTIAIHGLTAAMAANPLGLIVVGVTAVVSSILWLWRNWEFVFNRIEYAITFISSHVANKMLEIKMAFQALPDAIRYAWSKLMGFIVDSAYSMEVIGKRVSRAISLSGTRRQELTAEIEATKKQRTELAALYKKEQDDLKASLDAKKVLFESKSKALAEAAVKLREKLDKQIGGLEKPGEAPKKPTLEAADPQDLPPGIEAALDKLNNKEAIEKQRNAAIFQKFFEQRVEQEEKLGEAKIQFVKEELKRVEALEELTNAQRVAAKSAADRVILEEEKKLGKAREKVTKAAEAARKKAAKDSVNAEKARLAEIARINREEAKQSEADARARLEAKKSRDKEELDRKAELYAVEIGNFKSALDKMAEEENTFAEQRRAAIDGYLQNRMSAEQMNSEQRLEFLKTEQAKILELDIFTAEQRLELQKYFQQQTAKTEEDIARQRIATRAKMYKAFAMFADLGAANSKKLFLFSKAASAVSAGINSWLAYTEVLKDPSFAGRPFARQVQAALVLASGLAQQKKILSAKMPSYETGGRFVVPESPTSRVDSVGMRVNPGETVDVTPRGEAPGGAMTKVVVMLDGEMLYSSVQEGIDSGQITITNDNVRAA
jgi:tape measure domain-containing protein